MACETLTGIVEFDAVCRICGETKFDGLRNLFNPLNGTYIKKIEQITGMIFKNKAYLPRNICRQCREDLKKANLFRSRCIKTQYFFNYQRLKQIVEVKNNKEIHYSGAEENCLSDTLGDSEVELQSLESSVEGKPNMFFETLHNYANVQEGSNAKEVTTGIIKDIESELESFELVVMENTMIESHEFGTDDKENMVNKMSTEGEIVKYSIDILTEDRINQETTKKCRRKLNRFSCEVCGKHFDNRLHFQTHFNRHKGYKPFECKECPKKFYSRSTLNRHINQHKNCRPFECNLCANKFYSAYELTRHRLIHVKENLDGAERVNENISQMELSNVHNDNTSNDPNNTDNKKSLVPICEHCGKIFSHVRGLQAHVKRHNAVRKFHCEECSSKFFSNALLKRHQRAVHTEFSRTVSEKYICDECGAHFDNHNHFQTHLHRHQGYKPYECEYCPNKFYTKSELTRHRRCHTGERPYPCQFCELSFYDSSRRCAHEKSVHTKKCTYSCPYCGKAFILQKRFNLHIKSHENHRDFHCNLCNKYYKVKKQLNAHFRSLLHKRNEENLLVTSENGKEVNIYGGIHCI